MVDEKNQIMQENPPKEPGEEKILQFIGIRLENEIYGIPIEKIREIAKPSKVTAIPGSHPHITGLMNLHGEIVCIVDVKTLMNMKKSASTENSRVAVINTKEGPVGIFCDEVINIYDIMDKNIETPLYTLSNEIGKYITGQAQTHSGLMGILDIEGLLFSQEKQS